MRDAQILQPASKGGLKAAPERRCAAPDRERTGFSPPIRPAENKAASDGEPVTGLEVSLQRPTSNVQRLPSNLQRLPSHLSAARRLALYTSALRRSGGIGRRA